MSRWPSSVERLRRGAPEKKLVIEVTSVEAALAAAEAGFDVLQLEKFTPADVAALTQQFVAAAAAPAWSRWPAASMPAMPPPMPAPAPMCW